MYDSWNRGILGYDGIADIIDVAYELESGAGRFMRWRWSYPEALESISQSGVRLYSCISVMPREHEKRNSLEMRCLL